MISTTVLRFLIILIGSFAFGLLFYYMMSTKDKTTKKKELDQITSFVINIVIYIWLGKIIVNFSVFIEDPFAILAYPSDRRALYIALILASLQLLYQQLIQKKKLFIHRDVMLTILLATLFMYEVLQIVIEKSYYYFLYVILYTVLLILYLILQKSAKKIDIIVYTWFIAQIGLWIYIDSIRFFQYIVSPIFIFILFAIYIVHSLWRRKME